MNIPHSMIKLGTLQGWVSSQHFKQARRPHATAHAHGHHHIAHPAPFTFEQRMPDHPRAAHAKAPSRDQP